MCATWNRDMNTPEKDAQPTACRDYAAPATPMEAEGPKLSTLLEKSCGALAPNP